MLKRGFIYVFAVTAATGLAMAQSTKTTSSTKSASDPMQSATKPLTPKSAMPGKPKSTVAVPPASTGSTTAVELNHLERTNVAASSKASSANSKNISMPKSGPTTANSQINFNYQKPAGGAQAVPPKARTANSNTPRVKKN
jgi:hypothetical protein